MNTLNRYADQSCQTNISPATLIDQSMERLSGELDLLNNELNSLFNRLGNVLAVQPPPAASELKKLPSYGSCILCERLAVLTQRVATMQADVTLIASRVEL